jgi:hypothetical protein
MTETTKTSVTLAIEVFVAKLIESKLPVEIKYSRNDPSGSVSLEVTYYE